MRFEALRLEGAHVVVLEPHLDERGFFARTWCRREFEERGLEARLVQCNLSLNRRRGIVRGMHLQVPPRAEAKVVRCLQGAIHDVIVDLRTNSPTFGEHAAVRLTAENRRALYVPEGFAHGFQALEDDTEVWYQMSEFHSPEQARGFRFDDPAFGIEWPIDPPLLKDRDLAWPAFDPAEWDAW